MSMAGFSQRWKDFPDYILGITRDIWEGREVGSLTELYAENIPMRYPSGIVQGNRAVIDGTLATLVEFPDRQLLGEDVIWSEHDEHGLLSSHRIMTTGTHLADGIHGSATGRRIGIRAIADCAARNNQIYDEWLIRDEGGLIRQLGGDPREYALAQIEQEGGPERCGRPFTPDQDIDGGYHGRGNDNEFGARFASFMQQVMQADLSSVHDEYDRACHVEYAGSVTGHGHSAVDRFWLGLRSAFPAATFRIDHQIGREDPLLSPRAAIRWSLTGKHDGWGSFARPTGAPVHVMGFSHAEFGPRGIRREYTLIDEVAIWKQIAMHTG